MDTEQIMSIALEQAAELQKNAEKYERAKSSIEAIDMKGAKMSIYMSMPEGTSAEIKLFEMNESRMEDIKAAVKEIYEREIIEAEEAVKCTLRLPCGKNEHGIINKEFDEAINEMIADGNKKDEQKRAAGPEKQTEQPEQKQAAESEKKAEVAPVQHKRFLSKDVVSDADLKRLYFKNGKTVREIAERYGIGTASIYKRVEEMKKKQESKTKELARP